MSSLIGIAPLLLLVAAGLSVMLVDALTKDRAELALVATASLFASAVLAAVLLSGGELAAAPELVTNLIEKTIENAALYELDRLEKRLGVLATTANVAPMLGFLGTVAGMIKSFATLAEQGLTNPAAVAVGISEALITTATGLIIAIPAQLIYNWYTTKITRFVRDIETASNMLVETFTEMDSQRYAQGGEGQA